MGTVLPLRRTDDLGPVFLKFHEGTIDIEHEGILGIVQTTILTRGKLLVMEVLKSRDSTPLPYVVQGVSLVLLLFTSVGTK